MGLICVHRHDMQRTWFNRLDWRSYCRGCGTSMLKDQSSRQWRIFRPSDSDARRYANPDPSA